MHIIMTLYLRTTLLTPDNCQILHKVLLEGLPTWTSRLHVMTDDEQEYGTDVGAHTNLFESISSESPVKRGLGDAILSGSYPEVAVYLNSSDPPYPPELNTISFEIEANEVEGQDICDWCVKFFSFIVSKLPVRFGFSCASEEYDAKNVVSSENGTYAVGVQLTSHLPGVYWLNYYGSEYATHIGHDIFESLRDIQHNKIRGGYMIALSDNANNWNTTSYKQSESLLKKTLGIEYFYSPSSSDTKAPSFK